MAKYLLDTNYLVYLADEESDETKRKEVLEDLAKKLAQEDTYFALTPLIRYEVLRGVDWQNTEKLQKINAALEQFESLDINKASADLARDLYRFDSYQAKLNGIPKNLEKRKFDMFHYAVAFVNGLEILSKDSDIAKIEDLHKQMLATK
ncbi:type II toxin-antitoxin system VapC family toxin [Actinobacillus vicugnae]|uniref:type II toxin-antitoxin system VapC family toxin n=1 Tax=Actinobacillus vicugnae TaxID=2573093 RepID=UPI00123F259C|nr:PIN domain-containing protein [Actinobacillus vicugnae]